MPFSPSQPAPRLTAALGILAVILASIPLAGAAAGDSEPVSYSREVRPILSNNCFACHGPDEQERAAGLQLDKRDPATADLGGYAAIVPGNVEASEIWSRIVSTDPNEIMPPPKSNKPPLSEQERDILRRWIEQGAVYEPHWAFQPIEAPAVPQVRSPAWVRNAIDAFVLAELESKGIRPSPEADRHTLVRRLYLDLVGLTPSPEQIALFVNDTSPDAYEKLVDELLASPHYGERWGRHWLDQARYADSDGYSIDNPRTMWPYRDWVIRAHNDDMPFDRFTIEQIAGDLLPDATPQQILASAFHRNTLINDEGGSDPEQFRNEVAVDRVNTTGAVWLGLTLACAQCHTHKYDPVTHEDYFRMFAFFNQTTDRNNRGEQLELTPDQLPLGHPALNGTDPQLVARLKPEVERLEAGRDQRKDGWTAALAALPDTGPDHDAGWTPITSVAYQTANNFTLSKLEDGSFLIDPRIKGNDDYHIAGHFGDREIKVIRLTVLPHDSLPAKGPGTASNGNFVLTGFEILANGEPVAIHHARASHEQPDYPVSNTLDGLNDTGWAINVGRDTGRQMNSTHRAEFILEQPLPANTEIEIRLLHQRNPDYFIGHFQLHGAPAVPSLAPLDEHLGPELIAAARTAPDARNRSQNQRLEHAFNLGDAEFTALKATLAGATGGGSVNPVQVMVMMDLPPNRHRETFIHLRGDFLSLDKDTGPLEPGVPAVLPQIQLSNGRPANRLDLAQWLVRPDNPLTPRVTVNRIWMRYFAHGLVETEEDFGMQGSLPSHPELLDWLAHTFIAEGWSMKKLHRLIVTSNTYRQASAARPDLFETDPRNLLLARQHRLRVDAEIVRDLMLSASGELVPVLGGPPVFPPQPDGVYAFTQRRKQWNESTGDDRRRRTLYTHFYRSAPYPLLTTFDAPDFGTSCTRRAPSNTPLQALTLANDEGLHEFNQAMGARLLREIRDNGPQTDQARLIRAFHLALGRDPEPVEIAHLREWLAVARQSFADTTEPARQFAGPAALAAAGNNAAEAAAWVGVARVIFNTDEFITRE